MKTLKVDIEIEGTQIYVGNIFYNQVQDAYFQYAKEYLENSEARAISISLPLRNEAFSVQETKIFFEGLLPEGFTRRSVAQWMHLNEDDYVSILAGLGRECLGAIRITDINNPCLTGSYEALSEKQIVDLAGEGATKSTQMVTKAHLSLTGASGKVGLYHEKDRDVWYLPIGDAPSTHIVKQSHVRLQSIVTNEQLCLLTAESLGIEIPNSFIINTGKAHDGEILFATKRYDRTFEGSEEQISGLKKPLRLHQEDFAQALGIASMNKYETNNEDYLKKAFTLLRNYSADPIADQLKLWDMIVFDYLVGNTDNHIKNISLIYSKNLKSVRLAPAYDIVSTAVYEESTRDMAMSIGGKYNLNEIDVKAFMEEADKIGLNPKMAIKRYERMCNGFEKALRDSANRLWGEGFKNAMELSERILNETYGIYRK